MTDLLERIREALGGRYSVERVVGHGGMATVFLARDLKHERTVAVKVLRQELTAAVGSPRFLREIKITAGLSHPHILPLLDSGEADGSLFYVMPYLDGGSLRTRLSRESSIALGEALRITEQVASALDYAHRHKVVHRDIKPENILFSDGHAIVADFGVARALSAAGGDNLTRTGFPLGTLGYMSPEQAAGRLEVDERSDVYSLACVTYEMLIGETPGVWPSEEATRLGRLIDAPSEHRARLDRYPGRVEQVLARAMALRPSDRYQTPGEFAHALLAVSEHGRRLSDKQVREVLGRAAELEVAQDTHQETTLTVGAVEQVAAQVGIAPEHVRRAAQQLELSRKSALSGVSESRSPTGRRRDTLLIERRANGEVRESQFGAIVEEIQGTLGITGHVSILEGTLTWSPAAPGADSRKIVVTVASREDGTQIRVEERFEISGWRVFAPGWGAAGAMLFLILVLVGLGLGVSEAAILPILAAGFAGAYLTVAGMIKSGKVRREPQLQALADRLAALVERRALPAPAEATANEETSPQGRGVEGEDL
jgi:hypothetical protein